MLVSYKSKNTNDFTMVFGISKENPKALSRKLFCAISECRPTSDKENNVSLFKVSASNAQEWSLAVGFQLKTNQKICSLHFQEEDIIKGKIILNTYHPHRWLLSKGAVPIFNHRQSSATRRQPMKELNSKSNTEQKPQVTCTLKPSDKSCRIQKQSSQVVLQNKSLLAFPRPKNPITTFESCSRGLEVGSPSHEEFLPKTRECETTNTGQIQSPISKTCEKVYPSQQDKIGLKGEELSSKVASQSMSLCTNVTQLQNSRYDDKTLGAKESSSTKSILNVLLVTSNSLERTSSFPHEVNLEISHEQLPSVINLVDSYACDLVNLKNPTVLEKSSSIEVKSSKRFMNLSKADFSIPESLNNTEACYPGDMLESKEIRIKMLTKTSNDCNISNMSMECISRINETNMAQLGSGEEMNLQDVLICSEQVTLAKNKEDQVTSENENSYQLVNTTALKKLLGVTLPESWRVLFNRTGRIISYINNGFYRLTPSRVYSKVITILTEESVRFEVNSFEVRLPNLSGNFDSTEELEDIMAQFDRMRPCEGIAIPVIAIRNPKTALNYSPNQFVNHSSRCLRVTNKGSICRECKRKKDCMRKRVPTALRCSQSSFRTRMKVVKSQLSRKKQQANEAIKLARLQKKNCQQLEKKKANECRELFLAKLAPQERLVVETLFRKNMLKTTDKHGKGMRYSPAFILFAAMIRMKSVPCYVFLRNEKILPLPCLTTVRKLISSTNCEFGFSEFAAEEIQRFLEGKSEEDRLVTLSWDEVSIQKDVHFDAKSLQFRGPVDYGDEVIISEVPNKLADHALIFMCRAWKHSWVQPIGVFATSGACKAEILSQLITKALILLFKHGALVKSTVCDGAATNKAALSHLGVSGAEMDLNSINHPMDENKKVYCIIDPPHLMKCTRNHFVQHKTVFFGSSLAHRRYFEELYRNIRNDQLRCTSKLSPSHLNPSPYQKMNVRLATQLFSNSNAMALARSRSAPATAVYFKDSKPTEQMTKLLNDAFDVLNARCPKEAITKDMWTYGRLRINEETNEQTRDKPAREVLETLLQVVLETEQHFLQSSRETTMFASRQTIESWKITLQSALALGDESFKEYSYHCIYTAKWNQDCLERFFSIIRQFSRKPSAFSLVQIYRLLSLYTPAKVTINNANVSDKEQLTILANYADCLLARYKKCEVATRAMKAALKDQLMEELLLRLRDESSFTGSEATKNDEMVYQICGYLVKTRKSRLADCEDCTARIVSSELKLPKNFSADRHTSWVNKGKLCYVTVPFFETFREIEKVTAAHFSSNEQVFLGDSFKSCIDQICTLSLRPIFCEEHIGDSLPFIIFEYLTVRHHFHAKYHKELKLSNYNAREKYEHERLKK